MRKYVINSEYSWIMSYFSFPQQQQNNIRQYSQIFRFFFTVPVKLYSVGGLHFAYGNNLTQTIPCAVSQAK